MMKTKARTEDSEMYVDLDQLTTPNLERQAELRGAAMETLKAIKGARVNIRMSAEDIRALKRLADREGIGYQTLMSSVIHKYVTGTLVEKADLNDDIRAIVREEMSKKAG